MIVFARGSITNPDELAPFVDDEMRVIKQRKDDGVIKTVYRRAAGPGTFVILEGESIDAIRKHVETLPFVRRTHDALIRGDLRNLRTHRGPRSEEGKSSLERRSPLNRGEERDVRHR
jgi:hypothetical protein